jgi:hypothetical protein
VKSYWLIGAVAVAVVGVAVLTVRPFDLMTPGCQARVATHKAKADEALVRAKAAAARPTPRTDVEKSLASADDTMVEADNKMNRYEQSEIDRRCGPATLWGRREPG